MTYQKRDRVIFEDDSWVLEAWDSLGHSIDSVFCPSDFGLRIKGVTSTACYRGYCCTYQIHNDFLQLSELEINLGTTTAPLLNGRQPIRKSPEDFYVCGNTNYSDVQLPIPFTGGLILCRQPISKLPTHIGPELIWRYESIRELILENGHLVETYDHSAALTQIREEIRQNNGEIVVSEAINHQDDAVLAQFLTLEAKINDCFKLDY